MPCETAWLGWFKEIDEHRVMFLDKGYYYDHVYKHMPYTWNHVPVKPIAEECFENDISACEIYPAFRENGVHSFEGKQVAKT